jgi:anti-sigma regulatory factor (Ser/Thr protein kinase)
MATVEVAFTPLPAHVRTARLVATAVARRSGVDESLLDEVRLAVGEACSRAVDAHQRHCPDEPVRIRLTGEGDRFEVVVTDSAPADGAAGTGQDGSPSRVTQDGAGAGDVLDAGDPDDEPQLPAGVGLAVIVGLADEVRISSTDSGLTVRMCWHWKASTDTMAG